MGLTFSREGLENQKCYGEPIDASSGKFLTPQAISYAFNDIMVNNPARNPNDVSYVAKTAGTTQTLTEAQTACSKNPDCKGIIYWNGNSLDKDPDNATFFAPLKGYTPFTGIETIASLKDYFGPDVPLPPTGAITFTPVKTCPPPDTVSPKKDTAPVESSSSAPDSAGLVAGGSSPLPNTQSDFEQALALYRSNYVQFLSTGNPAYKTAYQNAQDAIEKFIQDRQSEVERQKHDMKRFADSYQEGNSELSDIYDSASGLFMNAQQIEDTYRTAKQRYDEVVAPGSGTPVLDVANGYAFLLRFGLILIFLPILFLIGWWSPQIKAAASTAVSTAVTAVTAATTPLMSSPTLGPMRT